MVFHDFDPEHCSTITRCLYYQGIDDAVRLNFQSVPYFPESQNHAARPGHSLTKLHFIWLQHFIQNLRHYFIVSYSCTSFFTLAFLICFQGDGRRPKQYIARAMEQSLPLFQTSH